MGMLDGKVVVITGTATGIGAATARLFAREGALLALGDVQDAPAEAVAAEIAQGGGRVLYRHTDVSRDADVKALVGAAVEQWGGIDVMFNNAGVFPRTGYLAEIGDAEYDTVLNINLRGAFLGMRHAIPRMIERGGGSIISTSSIAALQGLKLGSVYCATKAAIIGLTRAAAVEYADKKIRVNAILPGVTATPQAFAHPSLQAPTDEEQLVLFAQAQPLRRPGLPEDIAKTALWLASDWSDWITGQTIIADGGFMADPKV